MNIATTDQEAELRSTFVRMRIAQRSAPYPDRAARADRLRRLEGALLEHEELLVAAMQADFGHRSEDECRTFDITLPLSSIRKARRDLKRLMRTRRVRTPLHLLPARMLRQPQPLGVVGIIAPWNFPVYLALGPLAAALAAGNRVILKPSEITPRTSDVLSRALNGAFAPDELRVVLGGPDIGAAFAALPFDHLFFTGSTQVGRKVAEAAARNLTPVTLELGGKSPVIVAPDADLDRAATRIAFGKLANAGQMCVSPDYALVPRPLVESFVEKLTGAMHRLYPDGTAGPDFSAIITAGHAERLTAMLADAEQNGARILRPFGRDAAPPKLAPALVVDPGPGSRILEDEIFGPYLAILPYDGREEAAAHVAAGGAPLVLYLFTRSAEEQTFWQTQSLSGGMSVNETAVHFAADTLPVGGVGQSGMGAYHGDEGFLAFSHMKSVFRQPALNGLNLLTPPFTALKRRVSRMLRRLL